MNPTTVLDYAIAAYLDPTDIHAHQLTHDREGT